MNIFWPIASIGIICCSFINFQLKTPPSQNVSVDDKTTIQAVPRLYHLFTPCYLYNGYKVTVRAPVLPPDEQRRREQVFIDTLIRNIFRPGVERIPEPKMVVIKSDTGKWDLDEVVQLGVVGQVNLFGIQKMPGVLTVSPVIPKKEIAKLVGRSNFSYEVILSKNRPF